MCNSELYISIRRVYYVWIWSSFSCSISHFSCHSVLHFVNIVLSLSDLCRSEFRSSRITDLSPLDDNFASSANEMIFLMFLGLLLMKIMTGLIKLPPLRSLNGDVLVNFKVIEGL